MTVETWKQIPGYEGKYEVSDLGNVRSTYREQEFDGRWGKVKMRFQAKALKISRTRAGYCYLSLSKDSEQQKHLLHRLVMLAFVGPSDFQVNHKDGRKENNALENLEYATASENLKHCIHVLGKKRGEGAGGARLTTEDVLKIREDKRTLREIAADYGVTLQAIHLVKARKNWAHIA